MSGPNDLINFDIIEAQKENIQALPSGRSARTLANLFSNSPLQPLATPTPSDSKNVNDAQRAQFEQELLLIDETDDPLDVYDRYVRWTMDAYPSAQATKESQLLPLLERATKTFLSSTQYKNDPRYLKLWISYIRFFSDTQRETFAFLSRHAIGQELALFYEEFAAWLEGANRWAQADEIYNFGISRGARPVARLTRKYNEFQQRLAAQPRERRGSLSPALPVQRAALGVKMNPFATIAPADPQAPAAMAAPKPTSGTKKMAIFSDAGDEQAPAVAGSGVQGWDSIGSMAERKKENYIEPTPWAGTTLKAGVKKSSAPKMQIFKDEVSSLPPPLPHLSNVDDHRTNEWLLWRLVIQFIPISQRQHHLNENSIIAEKEQVKLNAKGRHERIYVNLEAMYPTPHIDGSELCTEELMARDRGYWDIVWEPEVNRAAPRTKKNGGFEIFTGEEPAAPEPQPKSKKKGGFEIFTGEEPAAVEPRLKSKKKGGFAVFSGEEQVAPQPVTSLTRTFEEKLVIPRDDGSIPMVDENGNVVQQPKQKQRRIKRVEVNETQTSRFMWYIGNITNANNAVVKTNLSSPSKKKKVLRRKSGATGEQTMTFHTKAATDDIYQLFNQPVKKIEDEHETSESESEEEESEEEETDGDYTTDAESTGTGHLGNLTDAGLDSDDDGDDTTGARSEAPDDEDEDMDDAKSEFSDFTRKDLNGCNEAADSDVEIGDGDVEMGEGEPISQQHTPQSPAHSPQQSLPPPRTIFIPIPPEDYVAPTNPYRNPAQISQNRLPFMTPIVERTESNLGSLTGWANKEDVGSHKTPSKENGGRRSIFGGEPRLDSSPMQAIVNEARPVAKIPPPALGIKKGTVKPAVKNAPFAKDVGLKGQIIKDAQCNPVDDYTRAQIFAAIQPPVQTYDGFFDHSRETIGKAAELKRYSKAVAKLAKNSADKTLTNLAQPPVLNFPGADRKYEVKRELGAGAFAPVYLIENVAEDDDDEDHVPKMGHGAFDANHRRKLEALKMEDPPSPWEFYIMRQAKRRLGVSRAAESIVSAYEFHLYKDECFLIEEFRDQGTLLDLVNIARADSQQAGGVMDEILAMFFSIELLRTIEALHKNDILHGDLKADNILVRFSQLADDKSWASRYRPDGTAGWADKGVALIDFGRGIDMKAFRSDVGFIADWKTGPTDCPEMRDLRPWTYQIDYFGLAGILHSMLFGKYIETVADSRGVLPGTGAGGKKWKIKESLKRYWQTEIWGECFDLLLNPTSRTEIEEGGKMPCLKGLKATREKMERCVEENCEKGMGLQIMLKKLEMALAARRK